MTLRHANHTDRVPLFSQRPRPGLLFIGAAGCTHEIVAVTAGVVYVRGAYVDRTAWGYVSSWRQQLASGVIRLVGAGGSRAHGGGPGSDSLVRMPTRMEG